MRRNRDDGRHLGAASCQARDEALQIMGKATAIVILHKAAHAIEIGMRDKESCRLPGRFMRSEKAVIVINGRAWSEAANQAKTSRFLAAFGTQFALICWGMPRTRVAEYSKA